MEKTLLVIGASSDMGIALIKSSYTEYDYIIAQYRNMNDKLEEIVKELDNKINLIQADLALEEEVDSFIEGIKSTTHDPTHIVHFPAPQCQNSKFNKIPWEVFQREIDVSLKSLVKVLQEYLPKMTKKKSGKVVVMLSYVVNNIAPAYCSNYVITKYALLGLVKSLATEYANKGITINGVSPAWVDTKYVNNQPDVLVNQNIESSPIGRLLTTNDIIPSIRFLLSDGADCINGQNITIACGR